MRNRSVLVCIPSLIGLFAGGIAVASSTAWDGRIVRVVDGDSLILRVAGEDIPVRLARIDAPEWNQPYGRTARRVLSNWVLNKRVRVDVVDTDMYDRSVVEMFVEGMHVNREMVRAGHAWAYTQFVRSSEIIQVEREARAARVGLWGLPANQRQSPFSWRMAEKKLAP